MRTYLSLALLLPCTLLRADQVTLKNGDRLTGSVVKFDGKNLIFKSEYAGPVTLPWDAVTTVTSASPLHIGLQDGQTVVGVVSTDAGNFQVQTQNTGTIVAARDTVKSIRSNEEQAAYDAEIERYRNPRLIDLWAGFVDLGYALTQGNADTSNLTVSANANRVTRRDKTSVYFTSLYARSDAGGRSVASANARRGGLNYSRNISPRVFAFGSVDLEFDQFQSLDLRFSPAGGFGYHAVKTERSVFDLLGGVSLNKEYFSNDVRRTSGEILLGEEWVYKLSNLSSLRHKLVFYSNVTDTGNYRVNFDTSAVTTLRKWMAWQFTVSDRLLSNPVPGRKKNDLLVTTGLRFTFAR
jgi:putative salt-induced outer membrane protein